MTRSRVVATSLLVATTTIVAPAAADGTVCHLAAQVAFLSDGVYYPIVGPTLTNVTTGFWCSGMASVTFTAANCLHSTGYGSLVTAGVPRSFSLVWIGNAWIISGEVNGKLTATVPLGACMFPGPGAGSVLLSGTLAIS